MRRFKPSQQAQRFLSVHGVNELPRRKQWGIFGIHIQFAASCGEFTLREEFKTYSDLVATMSKQFTLRLGEIRILLPLT